jgi:UDP-N-acetylglucosamine--N-acetylmuramyl-(pentapeptide) pyrophosphoryl-undecaprenol N-acetylglucosamine transferase
VGNPVREPFWHFDRARTRAAALDRYGLGEGPPVLGVVGGSLGAGVINRAVVDLVTGWEGPEMQVLHITGGRFHDQMKPLEAGPSVRWVKVGFEANMESFYAATDLVLARAGGAVAELTATATPSVLVPGEFGSKGHQRGNAVFLSESGAAITLAESELAGLAEVIGSTLFQPRALSKMREKAHRIARPQAAHTIADAMIEAAV